MNIFDPVRSKTDFVKRYQAGEFGNASPTWHSPMKFLIEAEEGKFIPSGYYHVRNRIRAGETYYNQTFEDVNRLINGPLRRVDSDWYVSAMAPTEKTLLQGEVQRSSQGLYLLYSQVRKPMRDALRDDTRVAVGLSAKLLLDRYLNARSREWLEYLLDSYPDHIVEFSAYERCWGTVPGHNTVFWECRLY